jgi:hypothetical protein
LASPPADKLTWAEQARSDTTDGLFASLLSAKEMNFNAPRKIEASWHWGVNDGSQIDLDHLLILDNGYSIRI